MRKLILTIIGWFGLLFILPGLVLSYSSSWVEVTRPGQLGSGVGYFVEMCAGALGTILALIGGFLARPKYLWIGAIVVGVAYTVSFYGYIFDFEMIFIPGLSLMLLPGMACIVGGIFMRKLNKRAQSQP